MEAIIVALIGLLGGVLVALIQKNRKQEKAEHGMVMQTLQRVETKVDGHIEDHAKGYFIPKEVFTTPKRKAKAR